MKNLTVLHDEKNSIMKRLNRNMRRLYGTAVLSVISAVTFIIVWAVVAITLSQLALFLGI
jgi:cobalamin biosynthesis protein CobD/CbiB